MVPRATAPPVDPQRRRSPAQRRRRRVRCFRLAAIAFGLIAGLLLAEATLRFYVALRGWTPNCYAYSVQLLAPDPVTGMRLAPDFHVRSGVTEITTNSLGFRGPPLAIAKPAGTRRIAVLGGSSVFGYSVRNGQEACRRLEDRLSGGVAGHSFEVINAGVPAYNLYQTNVRFRRSVAPLQPDIVVLYLGWNDLSYLISDTPDAARFRILNAAPWWDRIGSHSTLYGLVVHRLLGAAPQFAPPLEPGRRITRRGRLAFEDNLNQLVDAIERSGGRAAVCTQLTAASPNASASLSQFVGTTPAQIAQNVELATWLADSLRRFADRRQLPLVDVAQHLEPSERLLEDVIHLTPQGESELAKVWERALRRLLAPKDAPPLDHNLHPPEQEPEQP